MNIKAVTKYTNRREHTYTYLQTTQQYKSLYLTNSPYNNEGLPDGIPVLFGIYALTAHLAYHVHKGGRNTSLVIFTQHRSGRFVSAVRSDI